MNLESRLQKLERIAGKRKQITDDPERICNCKRSGIHLTIPGFTAEEVKQILQSDNPERCPNCKGKYISVEIDEYGLEQEQREHAERIREQNTRAG